MKKDDTLAHYNIDPEAEMQHLDNAIGGISSVGDEDVSRSTIVKNHYVQLDSKFADGDEDEDSTEELEEDG